jgi:hypothetical protein
VDEDNASAIRLANATCRARPMIQQLNFWRVPPTFRPRRAHRGPLMRYSNEKPPRRRLLPRRRQGGGPCGVFLVRGTQKHSSAFLGRSGGLPRWSLATRPRITAGLLFRAGFRATYTIRAIEEAISCLSGPSQSWGLLPRPVTFPAEAVVQ